MIRSMVPFLSVESVPVDYPHVRVAPRAVDQNPQTSNVRAPWPFMP